MLSEFLYGIEHFSPNTYHIYVYKTQEAADWKLSPIASTTFFTDNREPLYWDDKSPLGEQALGFAIRLSRYLQEMNNAEHSN